MKALSMYWYKNSFQFYLGSLVLVQASQWPDFRVVSRTLVVHILMPEIVCCWIEKQNKSKSEFLGVLLLLI